MNPAAATKLFKHRLALYNKSYNAIIQTIPHFDTTTTTTTSSSSPDLPLTCLTGVPVAVKEVIDVAGLPTTLCDPSLQKGFASALYTRPKSSAQEATVVTRLRQAGALIVGKTNIPTKGLDVQCSNKLHGTTNNPWDPLRTSGGSSGGSCAAVASGMVPLALGTDLGGSLRIPASFCGVSSMRCSYGVVPTHGQQPPAAPVGDDEAESSLQIGPIAKDVRMLERFFQGTQLLAIPKEDEKNEKNGTNGGGSPDQKVNIAMSTGLGGMESDHLIKHFLETDNDQNALYSACNVTNVNEAAHATLNLKSIGGSYMAYARRYFVEMNGRSSRQQLQRANEHRDELRGAVDAILGDHDCWILPTCPVGVAFPHQGQGRLPFTARNEEGVLAQKMVPYWPMTLTFVMPFTVTGHPVVTMPVGTVDAGHGVVLPVGVQVVGRRGEDVALLATCRRMEDALWGKGVGPPTPPACRGEVAVDGEDPLW